MRQGSVTSWLSPLMETSRWAELWPQVQLAGGREGGDVLCVFKKSETCSSTGHSCQTNPSSVSPTLGVHLSFGNVAFLEVPFCFCFLYSARCSILPAAQVTPPVGGAVRRDESEKDRR